MQLCDYWESSKYGAAQCRELAGGCQGANGNNCYPYGLWSSSLSSTDYYTNRELGNGSFENMNVRHIIYAFGVRCVLDLTHAFTKENSKIQTVCSCVTTGRVLSTALHGARICMAAARAQVTLIAAQTPYGCITLEARVTTSTLG